MADWQVGDLALCIEGGDETRKGCIYTVARVTLPGEFAGRFLNTAKFTTLDFVELGLDDANGAGAPRFRKITPGAKIEGIEEPRRIKVPKPVREDA